MNSGLQCLSNTKEITDYFMSNGFLKDINSSNPLGTKGNLACAYA
jgi:ubiquitin C-terminal hydrolase